MKQLLNKLIKITKQLENKRSELNNQVTWAIIVLEHSTTTEYILFKDPGHIQQGKIYNSTLGHEITPNLQGLTLYTVCLWPEWN